jgi:DNA helicase-2/ATP-dependent DNA helicase PcrA
LLPDDAQLLTVEWPLPPLGLHRGTRVHAAAGLVLAADGEPSGDLERDISLLLAERDARAATREISLPKRVPASKFKDFVESPGDVASQLRRPMPVEPYRATMLGTIFHAWVEGVGKTEEALPGMDRLGSDLSSDERELDVDRNDAGRLAVPVAISAIDEEKLSALQQTFLSSEWGGRPIFETELEIQLPLGPNIVICKIDAIYENKTADGVRYEIVDWKTGAAPTDERDLEIRQYQLALYRLAYATWAKVPIESVDAAFYFVAHDLVVRPDRILGEAELIELWAQIY